MESIDHAGHRSEEPHQRSDHGDHLNDENAPLNFRRFLQDGFAQLEFQRLGVDLLVIFVDLQDTTERVAGIRRITLELSVDLATGDAQGNPQKERKKDAEGAQRNDHVADDAAPVSYTHLTLPPSDLV